MTEPKLKSEALSETTKTYLLEVFIREKYGRKKDISNKYMDKGTEQEDVSITLYSRYKKRPFFKNETFFKNDFISGTPDLIYNDTVVDIKTSWDIFTFMDVKYDGNDKDGNPKINKDYYWQLQCYMALTGSKSANLVYCLVNTPDHLIETEKRFLSYKLSGAELEKGYDEIDRLSIYDDIPVDERVFEVEVKRDDAAIERLYKRVEDCRIYLNTNLFKI